MTQSPENDARCPLPECDRAVWCRPPAPTCPHPGNRGNRGTRHSPALHARFGGTTTGRCGLPGCHIPPEGTGR